VGLAVSWLLAAVDANAQIESRDLNVDDPRPLAEALLQMTTQYPTVVTYEDPRYVYWEDIQDVTERVRQNASRGDPRILVPKGGPLHVTYEFNVDSKQPVSYADVLGAIVEAARVNPSGGRFAVRQDGEMFHVIPTQVRDISGKWVQQTSILDTSISLYVEEQDYYQLIKAILAEVSKANSVKILLNAAQFAPTFARHTGRVNATNQRARDVLMTALHAMSNRFAYRLLYDPGVKYYALNVHLAAEPAQEPAPTQVPPRPNGPSPAGGRRTERN
jgi:hypothetical protein